MSYKSLLFDISLTSHKLHDLNGTVYKFNKKEGLGLWCLMPLSTISQLYIVPEPTERALYLTRQHYRKTVHEGEDTNSYST
jgi:hypothetical protein